MLYITNNVSKKQNNKTRLYTGFENEKIKV